MDSTPISTHNTSDSGCISGTFESSHSFYVSTPKEESQDTPSSFGISRKRKANTHVRKLTDVIESCPSTPQFSSTLNEPQGSFNLSSVKNCLEDFHLYNSNKLFKDLNGRAQIPSAPCTPEKKEAKTPSSYSKYSESPRIAAQQLLYPNLKEVKGSPTPKLARDVLFNSTAKKALFTTNNFYNIVRTPVVMSYIFQHLSNGDLYRFSMVSKSCLKAIEMNKSANNRFLAYKEIYKINKENYRITPPNSPEKDETLSEASNENFNYFLNVSQKLTDQQQLQKCRKCSKACVVEHNIGQCEKCGFTYCLLCDSVSNSPGSFQDKCKSSKLLPKSRNQFCDLSNTNLNEVIENSSISLLNSPSKKYDSSGFYSENDTPTSARRNLSNSLISCNKSTKNQKNIKVLSNNNRIVSKKTIIERCSPIVPVVPTENRVKNEIIEPSSPPKVKNYAVCSKQSKRNLKRLTR